MPFKLLSIIAVFFTMVSLAHGQPTMEEIAADLKAKKKELEPFDEKNIKVDVESLGLDDVEKKPEAKPAEAPKEVLKEEQLPAPVAEPVKVETPAAEDEKAKIPPAFRDKIKSEEKTENKPEVKPEVKAEEVKPVKKISTQKYINQKKKLALKNRLEAEKKKRASEKVREEKNKKLKELREKYLSDLKERIESGNVENPDFFGSEKIVPRPKELNPFLSEEAPALPLVERYRTKDNRHIPIIPSRQENIDTLFDTVTGGSVSFFNSAYKNVNDPNAKNKLGDTLLIYSILMQRLPITASVLAKGGNPNLSNGLGYTPIDVTIELVDFNSLELLVNNEADINYRDNFGRTYLMHAARVGFLPAVELFVSKGLDVNAMDNDGFTALSIAYRHKKEAIVKYLLKNGAKTWVEKPYAPEEQSLIKELENRWK